jgi:hypothetical protein
MMDSCEFATAARPWLHGRSRGARGCPPACRHHAPDLRHNARFVRRAVIMPHVVPPVVYVRLFVAVAAIGLGVFQLARPKGTWPHKAICWAC